MAKIKVTYVKSKIGSSLRQKRTLQALGLGKLNSSVEIENNSQMMGMVNKIKHLLKVEEL